MIYYNPTDAAHSPGDCKYDKSCDGIARYVENPYYRSMYGEITMQWMCDGQYDDYVASI